jgi:hypothetical protein
MASIGDTTRPEYIYDQATDTWIPVGIGPHSHTPAAIGAISSSVVTTKGDLIVGTGSGTVVRQGVGADGSYLVADSTQADGLNWAGPSYIAGKNAIINGGFDVWQRGTSFTTSGAYTADRWAEVNGANSITYTRSTDVPSSLGFQYSMSRAGTGANTVQRVEAANAAPLAGQTATLSFYYKSTAGSDSLGYSIYHANSADNFGAVTQIGSNQTIATPSTSWTRVIYSFSVPAGGANGLAFYFFRGNTATSTTLITGVQVELGSVATPFSRTGGSIQGELAACQRYCYSVNYLNGTKGVYNVLATGRSTSSTAGALNFVMPVSLRVAPTSIAYGGNIAFDDGSTAPNVTALTISQAATNNTLLSSTVASGLTAFRPALLYANNDATAYVRFEAEL